MTKGGNVRIGRQTLKSTLSVTTDPATTERVNNGGAGMCVYIPSGSTITTLTLYAASETGGTLLPLYDDDGSQVQVLVGAGQAREIHKAFAAADIGFVGDNAGSIEVTFKG